MCIQVEADTVWRCKITFCEWTPISTIIYCISASSQSKIRRYFGVRIRIEVRIESGYELRFGNSTFLTSKVWVNSKGMPVCVCSPLWCTRWKPMCPGWWQQPQEQRYWPTAEETRPLCETCSPSFSRMPYPAGNIWGCKKKRRQLWLRLKAPQLSKWWRGDERKVMMCNNRTLYFL